MIARDVSTVRFSEICCCALLLLSAAACALLCCKLCCLLLQTSTHAQSANLQAMDAVMHHLNGLASRKGHVHTTVHVRLSMEIPI